MKIIWIALCAAAVLTAGETRTWNQSSYQDFEKGTLRNLSVRSDGRLSLAPKTTEVFDSATAYLWSLAQDSRGNLYTAGGPGAKLFRVPAGGKGDAGKGEKKVLDQPVVSRVLDEDCWVAGMEFIGSA